MVGLRKQCRQTLTRAVMITVINHEFIPELTVADASPCIAIVPLPSCDVGLRGYFSREKFVDLFFAVISEV